MIELTERFLSDVGGWQALKQARSLNAAGRVSDASYIPPLLRGLVREGETEYQAGLDIQGKTRVENLCRCRESRQWGKICAHSLAVGMAVIKPVTLKTPAPAIPESPGKAVPDDPQFHMAEAADTELHLILPPNLEAAWERGKIALGIEATHAGRRALLEAPRSGTRRVTAADLTLITAVRALNGGAVAGMLSLSRDQFHQLMAAAIDHPRVSLARKQPVRVTAESPVLRGEHLPEGGLKLSIVPPLNRKLLIGSTAVWSLAEDELTLISPGVSAAYLGVFSAPVIIDEGAVSHFLKAELPALGRMFRLEGLAARPEEQEAPAATAVAPRFSLQLEGSLNHLAAHLTADYGGARVRVGGEASKVRRDHASEQAALEQLVSAGFSAPDRQGQMTLRTERQILKFFASHLPRLEREWQVEIGNRFRQITAQVERVTPEVRIRATGEDWLEMGVDFATGEGERIPAVEIQRLLRSGQSHFRGKNGRLTVLDTDLLEDFEQVLADCAPQQRTAGKYRVARQQAGYLASSLGNATGFRLVGDPIERPIDPPDPGSVGDLQEILRPYQWAGVAGLHERAIKLGGAILADEMGLGKTLQALALIRLQRKILATTKPSLVVGPSSLVFNWQREAERFTPELRVLIIQSGDRSSAWSQAKSADLILTSYPILQRDLERFRLLQFGSVFLDEAQHIKNPDTQNAQSASALQADFRFVLTGTPVENSVRDVWSLLNFIAPGYLGDRATFRERYEAPIQRDPKAPELSRFQRRISPFLIRRRKRDVSSEIPEKTLQTIYYELSLRQASIYKQLIEQGRDLIAALRSKSGAGSARMAALSLLLRLRQTCCDPDLVIDPDKPALPVERSGKLEAFRELLLEALDGGHRVLVFSQFVRVLASLREVLETEEIGHCYLDGSTRDRAGEVDRFQAPEGPPVFLISLKAGGTGLNLTAADTVIHVDPWWNPAVEDQATDRVHRIGQHRPVTAYKLIARGTVEEKILALQERKRAVIDAVIESEEPMMSGLTDRDLEGLLSQ